MKTTWKQTLYIHWENTDISGKLSLSGLGQLLINTATQHAENLGFGYKELKNQNLNWVLFRMNIEIIRRPKWNEKITLTTWPAGISGLAGLREFVMHDEKQNILCKANSEWLIIDLSSRKPKRLNQFEDILKFEQQEKVFTATPPIANRKGNFNDLFSVVIRHSDMDLNKHATAKRYFNWMEDALYQIHGEKEIELIQITFFNETYLNETVVLQIDDKKTTVRGIKSNDGKPAFMAAVKFNGTMI